MDFLLRPWKESDLESLVEQANNMEIAKYMTDAFPHPYFPENGKGFIAYANQDNPVHIFAIDIDGKAVGGIGIHPQQDIMRKNAELGYWLGQVYWGKGIISRAIPQMLDFAFRTYDISRVFARPFGSNIGSQKVLEKAGFTLEAVLKNTIITKQHEMEDEWIFGYKR